MKIEINESESYDIVIPDKVTPEELEGLLRRLTMISKLMNKDSNLLKKPSFENMTPVRATRQFKWNEVPREKALEMVKMFYSENRNKLFEETGLSYAAVYTGLRGLISRHAIKEEEYKVKNE